MAKALCILSEQWFEQIGTSSKRRAWLGGCAAVANEALEGQPDSRAVQQRQKIGYNGPHTHAEHILMTARNQSLQRSLAAQWMSQPEQSFQ